jgi:hypothetical protein
MGSGFRTFTAGEVLTASNVQNYLMDQSVMTFGGSATRSSAIGTANFEEGMVSYLTDTDKLEVYNGTNWVSVAPTTSTPMGVLINSTSFSGVSSASFAADTFTTTYDNYRIIVRLTSSSSTGYLQMRLRSAGTDNTTSNYDSQAIGRQSGGVTSTFESANDTIWYVVAKGAGDLTAVGMDLFSPKASNFTLFATSSQGIGAANSSNFAAGGTFKASTSFDSATLISSAGTITGTYSIYGYNK